MLEGILVLWFIFVFLSLAFTAYDVREMPIDWVQKLGWILVVAYTGPVGLFFYLLTCRSPGPGLHATFTQQDWKQSINSEIHCLAGDATGIIVAAVWLSFFSMNNGTELVLEYISAFIFGWVIFQAGMMVNMYDNYWVALKKTFFAETVSMNCVMIGMIPTMMVLMSHLEHGHNPAHAAFWFSMGMATLVGGVTAYPINYYLVVHHLKHGCMTKEASSPKTPGPDGAMTAKPQKHQHHQMKDIAIKSQLYWIGGTFLALFIVVFITSFFVSMRF